LNFGDWLSSLIVESVETPVQVVRGQASTDVPSDKLDRKKLVSEVAGKSEAVQAATQRAKELTEPWPLGAGLYGIVAL